MKPYEVKGYGVYLFPDDMSEDEIVKVLREQSTKPMLEQQVTKRVEENSPTSNDVTNPTVQRIEQALSYEVSRLLDEGKNVSEILTSPMFADLEGLQEEYPQLALMAGAGTMVRAAAAGLSPIGMLGTGAAATIADFALDPVITSLVTEIQGTEFFQKHPIAGAVASLGTALAVSSFGGSAVNRSFKQAFSKSFKNLPLDEQKEVVKQVKEVAKHKSEVSELEELLGIKPTGGGVEDTLSAGKVEDVATGDTIADAGKPKHVVNGVEYETEELAEFAREIGERPTFPSKPIGPPSQQQLFREGVESGERILKEIEEEGSGLLAAQARRAEEARMREFTVRLDEDPIYKPPIDEKEFEPLTPDELRKYGLDESKYPDPPGAADVTENSRRFEAASMKEEGVLPIRGGREKKVEALKRVGRESARFMEEEIGEVEEITTKIKEAEDTGRAFAQFMEEEMGETERSLRLNDRVQKARLGRTRSTARRVLGNQRGAVLVPQLSKLGPEFVAGGFGFHFNDEGELEWDATRSAIAWGLMRGVRVPIYGKGLNVRLWEGVFGKMGQTMAKTPFLRGFHATEGLPEVLVDYKNAWRREMRKFKIAGGKEVRRLAETYTDDELKLISDIAENEGDLSNATEELTAEAGHILQMGKKFWEEAGELGLRDEDAVGIERYMRRVYNPKISQMIKDFNLKKTVSKITGSWAKRRGTPPKTVSVGEVNLGDTVYKFQRLDEASDRIATRYATNMDLLKKPGWVKVDEYRVIGKKSGGDAIINRDYTRLEREMMGENRLAHIRLGFMINEMAHDLALGRIFKRIADDSAWAVAAKDAAPTDWIKLPKTKVGKTSVRLYGKLAGMYVHPEVARMIKNANRKLGRFESQTLTNALRLYRKLLGKFKIGSTGLNPKTHTTNLISNVFMTMLDGKNPASVMYTGMRSVLKKDTWWKKAVEAGLVDSSIIAAERSLDDFARSLGKLKPEHPVGLLGGIWHYGFKLPANKMIRLYEAVDEVFKLGVYKSEVIKGAASEEALKRANELFFDYLDIPIGVQLIKDTYLPFFTYTYKFIPSFLKRATLYPHRLAAIFGAGYLLNQASYAHLYGKEWEDQLAYEDSLAERTRGDDVVSKVSRFMEKHTLFGRRSIRLPYNTSGNGMKSEKGVFVNTDNLVPGGDIFNIRQSSDGVPWPMVLGGNLIGSNPAVNLVYTLASGKHAFTGKDIYSKTWDELITPEERFTWATETVKAMADQVIPNSPFIPGSWSNRRLGNALVAGKVFGEYTDEISRATGWTGNDYYGEALSMANELTNTLGVEIRLLDFDNIDFLKANNLDRLQRDAVADLARTLLNGTKVNLEDEKWVNAEFDKFQSRIDAIFAEFERLSEKSELRRQPIQKK